jgi:hypothetical protein
MYTVYSCYAGENVCYFEFKSIQALNKFLKNECLKRDNYFYYAGHLLTIIKK